MLDPMTFETASVTSVMVTVVAHAALLKIAPEVARFGVVLCVAVLSLQLCISTVKFCAVVFTYFSHRSPSHLPAIPIEENLALGRADCASTGELQKTRTKKTRLRMSTLRLASTTITVSSTHHLALLFAR